MTTYDNTNSGALFTNKERKEDNHPNARGRINVEGKWYWLASWTKVSKNDEKFMSLAVTPLTEEDIAKYIGAPSAEAIEAAKVLLAAEAGNTPVAEDAML